MTRALCVAAVVGAVGVGSAHAAPHEPITDGLPYKLRIGELRVGLWKTQYGLGGLLRNVEVGTYNLPWIGWAAKLRIVNGHAKWVFWQRHAISASAGIGLFYLDLQNFDQDARLGVVPVDATLGYRVGRWRFGVSAVVTGMLGEGSYDAESTDELQGAVASNTGQLIGTVVLRASDVIALLARARTGRTFGTSARGNTRFRPDDATTLDVVATGSVESMRGGSMTAAAHFSWDRFNLRVGVTWGNYVIAGVNFMVPTPVTVPEFDLYWRF